MHNNKTIVATLVIAATLFAAGGVSAQSCQKNIRTGECVEKKEKDKPAAAAEVKYPNATRTPPALTATKIKKDWDAMVKAATGGDSKALLAAAETVLVNPAANLNEQSEAANQMAQANLKLDTSSYTKTIEYAEKAISLNGLGNNSHYQLMLVTGQMLLAEKRYAESLTYVDRFNKETGVDDLAVNKTRGNALYRLNRYNDAIPPLKKAYELDNGADQNLAVMLMDAYGKTNQKAEASKLADQIGKSSTAAGSADGSGQIKQMLVLASAKEYERAAKIFDELYAKGQITKANEYEAGYVSYSHVQGSEQKAINVINDGLAKKVIKPDVTMYTVLGQSYYYTNNINGAIDALSKGAAMSSKGDLDLQVAQALGEESRYAESKTAAQKALSKGTDNAGNAYILIAQAESEFGLNNKTAMIAALKEAEKYPETKSQAAKMLKDAGVK